MKSAMFAGGCFWCVESDFEKLTGVSEVVSGYAGGNIPNPTYKTYNRPESGQTSHIEVIVINYDDAKISYKELVQALFKSIDPTDNNGQFVDRGKEYRPVIFYADSEEKKIALAEIEALAKLNLYEKPVNLEVLPRPKFYMAESYHQNYYKVNPIRYTYYRYRSGRDEFLSNIRLDKIGKVANSKYHKMSDQDIRKKLTDLQYEVTQKNGTERSFNNEYWDNKKPGIYVDIVTGEPLFSSEDKFVSGTGWPSFTKPIVDNALVKKIDDGLFYSRVEIRSKVGDSHLGHVFTDGPKKDGGLRYCINSASLKFIDKKDMEKLGYGYLLNK